ncbi:putative membrane protein [Paraburkholderia caribensis MBA4]|uniref:Putative membrane protein n=1 Tax=Paraburkholderia caribensis MBA4 TaxID=1323664 RepID=A0A0N7JVB6_9BURK|nr:HdeD family acid-resistance protein [Paraburkholderia caribensis]ALL68757.1 putative membrane protein [Paraburkholderia caribensis MBA4]
MDELLGRAWWMLILRGTVALLFGTLALFWPGLTLLLLIALFSVYALASGVVAIVAAIRYRATHGSWWVPLLLGICSVGAGVIAALVPGITALVLVAVIGANAIITGVLDLIAATRLHRRLRNAWMLVVTGVLSVLFGIFVLLFPGAGALALVWLIAVYALFTGALLVVIGITARAWRHDDLTSQTHAPLHP